MHGRFITTIWSTIYILSFKHTHARALTHTHTRKSHCFMNWLYPLTHNNLINKRTLTVTPCLNKSRLEHKGFFFGVIQICCSQVSPWWGEFGSEKGYFVSNSIEWEGHTGQPCIYCRRNYVSCIGGSSPDIFTALFCCFHPNLTSFLRARRQGKELVHCITKWGKLLKCGLYFELKYWICVRAHKKGFYTLCG